MADKGKKPSSTPAKPATGKGDKTKAPTKKK